LSSPSGKVDGLVIVKLSCAKATCVVMQNKPNCITSRHRLPAWRLDSRVLMTALSFHNPGFWI